ncbi:MAG: hypothetical protein RIR18_2416, partial [Pseudomonadota bacterium]
MNKPTAWKPALEFSPFLYTLLQSRPWLTEALIANWETPLSAESLLVMLDRQT